jgi:hypothetical protein
MFSHAAFDEHGDELHSSISTHASDIFSLSNTKPTLHAQLPLLLQLFPPAPHFMELLHELQSVPDHGTVHLQETTSPMTTASPRPLQKCPGSGTLQSAATSQPSSQVQVPSRDPAQKPWFEQRSGWQVAQTASPQPASQLQVSLGDPAQVPWFVQWLRRHLSQSCPSKPLWQSHR